MKPRHSQSVRRRAFTLIELVIAVAILAILVGAAVPVSSKFFTSRARAATRTELDELAEAALAYSTDTARLPASAADLLVNPGVAGWVGPYVAIGSADAWSGASDIGVDAWAVGYRFTATGTSQLEVRSAAEGSVFGDTNDLVTTLDVTPIRREKTRAQLATLNAAITLYNGQYLPDTPLSTTYSALLARLVATSFLPSAAPYQTDAWGSAFQADPVGASPVVAVASPNVGSTSTAGGGSSGNGSNGNSGKGGKGNGKGNDSGGNNGQGGGNGANGGSNGKGKGGK